MRARVLSDSARRFVPLAFLVLCLLLLRHRRLPEPEPWPDDY